VSLIKQLDNLTLDGTQGNNRCLPESCQISARNDLEAIRCWLSEYELKPTTHRAYQKEAERLLLWSVLERRKPLSSLGRDDFETYWQFLSNPEPRHVWCGPKGSRVRRREDPSWRPFVGPLSPSAKDTALAIIDSLMGYLVSASYLKFNPLSLMRRKTRQQNRFDARKVTISERILEDDEWQALLTTLHALPELSSRERDEKARLRWLVAVLFLLGLRINELETHTWRSFAQVRGDWWFWVKGKGDKLGKVPVNEELLHEMIRFRRHLRLPDLPSPDETGAIVPSWQSNKPLSGRQMSHLLKSLATQASAHFADEPAKMAKLKRFSPHWLRHLSASWQDRAGIRFGHIKANHRHQSDETTRRYVHAIDKERHDDMAKLKLFFVGGNP
jgi:integrase